MALATPSTISTNAHMSILYILLLSRAVVYIHNVIIYTKTHYALLTSITICLYVTNNVLYLMAKVYRLKLSEYVQDALGFEHIYTHKSIRDIVSDLILEHLSPKSKIALGAKYPNGNPDTVTPAPNRPTAVSSTRSKPKPKAKKKAKEKSEEKEPEPLDDLDKQAEAMKLYQEGVPVRQIAVKHLGYQYDSKLRRFLDKKFKSGDLTERPKRPKR